MKNQKGEMELSAHKFKTYLGSVSREIQNRRLKSMSERKDHIAELKFMLKMMEKIKEIDSKPERIDALKFAINSLEVDEAYHLEYEKITNSKKCACYYCEHFEREGWSSCKIHEGVYGDARCSDYKELKHEETVTEFADRCRECGKTIKQKYILDELKEIREEIELYADPQGFISISTVRLNKIFDKKISKMEGNNNDR